MSVEHGTDSHKLTKQQLITEKTILGNKLYELQEKYDYLEKVYRRNIVAVEALHLYIEQDR